jgi:MerR family transcriptional regulator, light-induced transcriptional regulator
MQFVGRGCRLSRDRSSGYVYNVSSGRTGRKSSTILHRTWRRATGGETWSKGEDCNESENFAQTGAPAAGVCSTSADRWISAVTTRIEDPAQVDGMTIGRLSELVGVPVPTLRSWDRRYQMPPMTRHIGTTRLYTFHDVQILRLMRDDVARGIRAAEAAASVRALFHVERSGAPFISGLLDACDGLDPVTVGKWLDFATGELGLGPCLDEVLFPAMRQIGLRWQTNQCNISHVRATTDAVCRWLRHQSAAVNLPPSAPVVLLAPTDQHNVGLHALAVLLHRRHVKCGGLPADLSTPRLRAVLDDNRPAAVVVLSHLPATRTRTIARLRALQDYGTEVFYAGNAFASSRSRRAVPGRYLALNLQRAAELVATSALGVATGSGRSDH